MGKNVNANDFEDCLKHSKIARFPGAKKLAARELKTAQADLEAARGSLKNENAKWATIQAYYAMFHAARALLYSKGYREKSHYCLIVAMRKLFVEEGLIEVQLIDAFHLAKSLRENADYENEFSADSAETLVEKAEKFFSRAQDILH